MTWTARNNGLSGNQLNVNFIVQQPNTKKLPSQNHVLYIATDGGVFRSATGGRSWAKLNLPDPSNDEFNDSPAATVDELTFHWVAFDPRILNTVFVIAAKDSVSHLWIYRSIDAGENWTSRGIIAALLG